MRGKIRISATLKILTGLHIGGNKAFSPIGAVDSPVIDDPRTGRPIIPGSSLKGKLRYLLASHICGAMQKQSPNEDPEEVRRLFGSSEPIQRARLQFADSFVSNMEQMKAAGLREVKFENGIDRASCVANPRQIERVVSGTTFDVIIMYSLQDEEPEIEEDMKNLASAMRLLQIDYLGGHGSRGSGRVSFTKISLKPLLSDYPASKATALEEKYFKAVEEYELLHI